MTQHSPILKLSPELHSLISVCLEPLDRISLKLANRQLYHIISPISSIMELAEMQWNYSSRYDNGGFSREDGAYTVCLGCMRLRPNQRFDDTQNTHSPPVCCLRGQCDDLHTAPARGCIKCSGIEGLAAHRHGWISH